MRSAMLVLSIWAENPLNLPHVMSYRNIWATFLGTCNDRYIAATFSAIPMIGLESRGGN